jgi:outer membrane protein assembly factor BamB
MATFASSLPSRALGTALLVVVAVACQSASQPGSPTPGDNGGGPASATTSANPSSTVPAAFADVPMYRMDPTHQNVQPGPGPLGQPQLAWSVKAGGASTTPILGDGTLFFGSEDGFLYALDARTGADRWRRDLGAPTGVPVFGNGIVAVSDKNGVLHGVAAATGAKLWDTEPALNPSGLVLADGIVYMGADDGARGFDLQTGVERWSWTTTAEVGELAITADTAYIETSGGVLHAVTLTGARQVWIAEMSIPGPMSVPSVAGDVVLLNSLQGAGEPAGEFYALDRTSGKLLWRFRGPSGLQISAGAVRDGIIYAGSEADGIYAFRIADGTQVWQAPGPRVFFPASLVDDTLYLTSDTPPQIAAFRASDGSPLWALPTTETPKGHPVVSGGMLFGASTSGEIRAYGSAATVATGPVPTARLLTTPSAPPAIANPFEIIGRYSATELGLDRPLDLDIGPNGDAYVTETIGRVSQISHDGTIVRRWGTSGSRVGQFNFVPANVEGNAHGSIAVAPDGKVYISDSQNHRVQVFTADGVFIRQFGTFGTAHGQFAEPFDLSVDAQGNTYVLDHDLSRLSKFGPDGAFLWTVDGTADQELDGSLHGADIDSNGRIVVVNDGTRRVVYLDPSGKVVDAFDAGECDVTVDPDGNIYCNSFVADELQVYNPSHERIGSWSGPDMVLGSPPQFGPNGEILALDRDGGIVKLKVNLPPA